MCDFDELDDDLADFDVDAAVAAAASEVAAVDVAELREIWTQGVWTNRADPCTRVPPNPYHLPVSAWPRVAECIAAFQRSQRGRGDFERLRASLTAVVRGCPPPRAPVYQNPCTDEAAAAGACLFRWCVLLGHAGNPSDCSRFARNTMHALGECVNFPFPLCDTAWTCPACWDRRPKVVKAKPPPAKRRR